jgi:hypothetical protein
VEDRDAPTTRLVAVEQLREIAQFTEYKQFRPLRTAPTLQRDWHLHTRDASELESALQCLYPGGIADWFAAQHPNPPVTHYRDFTGRQTGMYRITASLRDEQVAHLACAGCHERFCLKQRLWIVRGLAPEESSRKSMIPCLEPCAVLLEFARVIARIEQREKHNVTLTPDELETIVIALGRLVAASDTGAREADFSVPGNRRRAQWVLEKLEPFLAKDDEHEEK